MKLPHLLAALLLLLSASCSSDTENADDDGGDSGGPPPKHYVGHESIGIFQVAMYQGIKRVLMDGGVGITSAVPMVAGREALLRVYYGADPSVVGLPIVGRLTIDDGGEPIDVPGQIVPESMEHDLFTTMNFNIPGDRIGANFTYRVELLKEVDDPNTADNPAAKYPVEGTDTHVVEGPQNTFRVVVAPFQYNADGSGRLPDLSDAGVKALRDRLYQLYPVSNVEVTVREVTPWASPINPDGSGWQGVGATLFGFRDQDGAADDVYYYAVFNPRDTYAQFCATGCLLGVTLLNNDPPDVGSVALRLGLGVGFPETINDTAAHELGHSHGRGHANCGQGLDPNSIDFQYPHAGGSIGVWGFDLVNRALIDPAVYTDIMGYCDVQWISDYNFAALLARGRNVNMPRYGAPTARSEHEMVSLDADGHATWMGTVKHAPGKASQSLPVSVITEGGHARQLNGQYFRWDHMPGGFLVFPTTDRRAVEAELVVDGKFVRASR